MSRSNGRTNSQQPTRGTDRPYQGYENLFQSIGPNGTAGGTCTICQSNIERTEQVLRHPACNNSFHVECLEQWINRLQSQRRTPNCPVCRGEFTRGQTEPGDRHRSHHRTTSTPRHDAGNHDGHSRRHGTRRRTLVQHDSDSWDSDDYRAWQEQPDPYERPREHHREHHHEHRHELHREHRHEHHREHHRDVAVGALQQVANRTTSNTDRVIVETARRFNDIIGSMVEIRANEILIQQGDTRRGAEQLETYHAALMARAQVCIIRSLNRFIETEQNEL